MEVSNTIATLVAVLVIVIIVSIAIVRLNKCAGGFCGGKDQHCVCDGNEKFTTCRACL